jgi:hypothetical protein
VVGALAVAAAFGFGCNSTDDTTSSQPIGLNVTPISALVAPGATFDFDASVTNVPSGASHAVDWSLAGTGCSGDACGTLLVLGATSVRYTAPLSAPVPQVVAVTATAVAEPAAQVTAYATIGDALITVAVSPATATVPAGGQVQLTATVVGDTANAGVNWGVNSWLCEVYPCGVVTPAATASGVATTFTASAVPQSEVTVEVLVSTVSDPTRRVSAYITITPAAAR